MPAALRLRGIALGALLGLGFLLQTWAITDTDAMMAGFLTGTLVVMAPAIGWALLRVRPGRATWIGVAVATVGLALLSLRGAGFGRGEVLTLLAAAVWALHLAARRRRLRPVLGRGALHCCCRRAFLTPRWWWAVGALAVITSQTAIAWVGRKPG